MSKFVCTALCFVLLAIPLKAETRDFERTNKLKSSVNRFSAKDSATNTIPVQAAVNPGMELVAIMLWLSNSYPQPKDSAYKSAVWTHFGRYRNDAALARLKKLEIYPDFTETGLLLSDFPNAHIVAPETCSWYEKYGRENVLAVLKDALTFARKTKFSSFHQKHVLEYQQWTAGFAKDVQDKNAMQSLDAFFRYGTERNRPRVTIYLEPLNGWGAHAIDFMKLRGEPNGDRVNFQLGPSGMPEELPDSQITFKGNKNTIEIVWHEASHVYLRQTLEQSKDRIDKLERLFNKQSLANQNIKTWDYAFEENLVRAVVAAMIKQQSGDEAYRREIRSQTQRSFIYTYEIAELMLSRYASNQKQYSNFDAFLPEVIELLALKQNPSDAKVMQ